MGEKEDFLDRLAGVPEEEIWFNNNVHLGDVFPFEDCECETWIAFNDRCKCGKTWIVDIDVIEISPGDYVLDVVGIRDDTVGGKG